jgi:hypothetical protein
MTAATLPSDNSLSLRQALEYCLDVLKMKQHFEFMIRTTAKNKKHWNYLTVVVMRFAIATG